MAKLLSPEGNRVNDQGKKLYKGYFNYYKQSEPGVLKSYTYEELTKEQLLKKKAGVSGPGHEFIGEIRLRMTMQGLVRVRIK
jgi:hypothetical protein